jgi:hypothetical protein
MRFAMAMRGRENLAIDHADSDRAHWEMADDPPQSATPDGDNNSPAVPPFDEKREKHLNELVKEEHRRWIEWIAVGIIGLALPAPLNLPTISIASPSHNFVTSFLNPNSNNLIPVANLVSHSACESLLRLDNFC